MYKVKIGKQKVEVIVSQHYDVVDVDIFTRNNISWNPIKSTCEFRLF